MLSLRGLKVNAAATTKTENEEYMFEQVILQLIDHFNFM